MLLRPVVKVPLEPSPLAVADLYDPRARRAELRLGQSHLGHVEAGADDVLDAFRPRR